MPIGLMVLLAIVILLFFGLGQRVLDELRLTDKAAMLIILVMAGGTFLPDIPLIQGLSINIGGGIIPIILVLYLIFKANKGYEKIRTIFASLGTGLIVYVASKTMGAEPETMFLDPIYLYSIVAGSVAYLLGRSRRAAFAAGVMGIVLIDIAYAIELRFYETPGATVIGGAGIFDTVVLSGFFAVAIAEIIGELRERFVQAGKKNKKAKPEFTSFITDKNKDESSCDRRDKDDNE